MHKAAPAFQFFPDAFDQGTADLTVAEVGAYIRLLCAQWAKGSIPGDHMTRLAAIMRCTPGTAKGLWLTLRDKFERGADGGWRNARMEEERQKQAEYRATQSLRGKVSAEKRWGKDNRASNRTITTVTDSVTLRLPPERNPKPDGNSLSLVSKDPANERDQVESTPSVARVASPPPPLIRSPLDYAKAMSRCAFVGQRLEVPNKLHADFRRLLGGVDPDAALLDWYAAVDAEITTSREAIVPDVFPWLQTRFKSWASSRIGDTEMQKFLEAAK